MSDFGDDPYVHDVAYMREPTFSMSRLEGNGPWALSSWPDLARSGIPCWVWRVSVLLAWWMKKLPALNWQGKTRHVNPEVGPAVFWSEWKGSSRTHISTKYMEKIYQLTCLQVFHMSSSQHAEIIELYTAIWWWDWLVMFTGITADRHNRCDRKLARRCRLWW